MKPQFSGKRGSNASGFTIVEILVVLAIMGIVALAVSSLYISSQRTASEQLGVSDVQANLRVAMDAIANDIRKAGFLTAADPVDRSASDASTLVLQSSAFGAFAKVSADSAAGSGLITVASAEMAGEFRDGQSLRIIRPPRFIQPQDAVFSVTDVDGNQVTIGGLNAGVQINEGDVLVGSNGGPAVHRTVYFHRTADNTLVRQVDGGQAQVLARNVTELEFQYFPSSGLVHSVSVKITGTTEGPSGKERELLSRVTVRNL